MGMNIIDIVALAKAGYKFSEVKELLTLANQSEDETAPEGDEKDQPKKTEQHDAGKEQPDDAPKKGTDTPEEDSAILSYKEKIQELEDKLQKLQSDNVHKDHSDKTDTKTDEETLDEITTSFM